MQKWSFVNNFHAYLTSTLLNFHVKNALENSFSCGYGILSSFMIQLSFIQYYNFHAYNDTTFTTLAGIIITISSNAQLSRSEVDYVLLAVV